MALLSVLSGRFEDARASLGRYGAALAGDSNLEAHVRHDLVLAELLLEIGDEAAAVKTALEFVTLKRGWFRTGKSDINRWGQFGEPRLVTIATRGDALRPDAARAERAEYATFVRANAYSPEREWMLLHSAASDTPASARAAAAVMPPRGPVPLGFPGGAALAGRVLSLAGRHAEAIPWLRDATARCEALEHPFENTRAHLWLGQSLEATGDAKSACAPYKVVVDRWGRAKPASVTAREAAARMKAIGCH
jgi:hypothetical protein